MIRVFVGIPASEEISKKITKWAEDHKDWPLRFVSGTGLHITVVQPWDAEESQITDYEVRCREAVKDIKAFKIRFKEIIFGTSSKRPRLIWTMGVDYDREMALKLKSAAETAFGQKPDIRPYNAHLTVARFKEADFEKIPNKDMHEKVDWEMTVDSIALYESKLLQSGAEYEILKKIELKR